MSRWTAARRTGNEESGEARIGDEFAVQMEVARKNGAGAERLLIATPRGDVGRAKG